MSSRDGGLAARRHAVGRASFVVGLKRHGATELAQSVLGGAVGAQP